MLSRYVSLTFILLVQFGCHEGEQTQNGADGSALNVDRNHASGLESGDVVANKADTLGLAFEGRCQAGPYKIRMTYNVDWLFYTTGKNRTRLNVSRKSTQMEAIINTTVLDRSGENYKQVVHVTKAYDKYFPNKFIMPLEAPSDLISNYFRGSSSPNALTTTLVGKQPYDKNLRFAGLPVTNGTRSYTYPNPNGSGRKSMYFTYFYDVNQFEKTNLKGQFVQVTCSSSSSKPMCDEEGTEVKQIRYTLAKVDCDTSGYTFKPIEPTNFKGYYRDSGARSYNFSSGEMRENPPDRASKGSVTASLVTTVSSQRVKRFTANFYDAKFSTLKEGFHKIGNFSLDVNIDANKISFPTPTMAGTDDCQIAVKDIYFGKAIDIICSTYATIWQSIWKQHITSFKITGDFNTTLVDSNLSSERDF